MYAIPVVVGGEYIGALDLFRAAPNGLVPEQIAGMAVAAALMRHPLLDLLHRDMRAAVVDPDSNEWAELNAFTRTEVSQATGDVDRPAGRDAAVALARLRAHAFATGRCATAWPVTSWNTAYSWRADETGDGSDGDTRETRVLARW